ncbi:unnamed protein product, partial [Nesidiocoris tenuis]
MNSTTPMKEKQSIRMAKMRNIGRRRQKNEQTEGDAGKHNGIFPNCFLGNSSSLERKKANLLFLEQIDPLAAQLSI